MAKKETASATLLGNTVLEIVRVQKESDEVVVKKLTYAEWIVFKKNPAFQYYAYQVGFNQFKK